MNLVGTTVLTTAAIATLIAAVVSHSGVVAAVGVGMLVTGRALLIVGRARERRAAERTSVTSSAELRRPPSP